MVVRCDNLNFLLTKAWLVFAAGKVLNNSAIRAYTNLFAVKSNILNRLFHPYGIFRRESKTTYNIAKITIFAMLYVVLDSLLMIP